MNVMITDIYGMVGTHMTDCLFERGTHSVGLSNKLTDPLFDVEQICWGLIHRLVARSYPATPWLCLADMRDINIFRTFDVCEVCQ